MVAIDCVGVETEHKKLAQGAVMAIGSTIPWCTDQDYEIRSCTMQPLSNPAHLEIGCGTFGRLDIETLMSAIGDYQR